MKALKKARTIPRINDLKTSALNTINPTSDFKIVEQMSK
jgi:hypothetical protein